MILSNNERELLATRALASIGKLHSESYRRWTLDILERDPEFARTLAVKHGIICPGFIGLI